MSHMVIFQTPDGNPGYNQFESLEEAVSFVEQLRNDQGVSTARMFALEEVKFDFKPYFRVELDPPMVTSGAQVDSPPVDVPPAFGEAVAGFVAPDAGRPVEQRFGEPAQPEPAPQAPPAEPAYGQEPAFGQEPAPAFGQPAPEGEPAGVGAPPPPTFMAVPPSEEEGEQPTRRGLFGR